MNFKTVLTSLVELINRLFLYRDEIRNAVNARKTRRFKADSAINRHCRHWRNCYRLEFYERVPVIAFYCLQNAKCSSGDQPCARLKREQSRVSEIHCDLSRVFRSVVELILRYNNVSDLSNIVSYEKKRKWRRIKKKKETFERKLSLLHFLI